MWPINMRPPKRLPVVSFLSLPQTVSMLKLLHHRATTHVLSCSVPRPPSLHSTVSNRARAVVALRAQSTSTNLEALTAPTPERGAPRSARCSARRRSVRYGAEDGDEDEEGGEGNGHNEEIAMLELYSQSARGEALIVHAAVDGEEVEVLIFKGFSSSLSHGTSPDPSRSILPARAEIKSIDRVKGPFDPTDIEYIEKGLTLQDFTTNILPNI